MSRVLNSFKIPFNGKILDYRNGERLNTSEIKFFFQNSYKVKKIWQGSRHILGILTKNNVDYFLKLSTSEGISVVTKNEYDWNDYFNQYFPKNLTFSVPKNYESGIYKDIYFYLITDYFHGKLLCDIGGVYKDSNNLVEYIPQIIELSELIQKLPNCHSEQSEESLNSFQTYSHTREILRRFIPQDDRKCECNYKEIFTDKVNKWFKDIPTDVRKRFKVGILLKIVEEGVNELGSRPRHGDFTPWHIFKLKDLGLGLIDGEHAQPDGVEGYDICYFIQRVFSVLKNPQIAQDIYSKLLISGYDKNKLKTVLVARAIGGFLDESLIGKANYEFANNFMNWIFR